MLTAYRRHLKNCRRRDEGRSYRNCRCPIWVEGTLGGTELRESLKVRDWQRAQEMIREWEIENRRTSQPTRKSAQETWKEFLADIEARKLNDSTARKYKLLNRQMEEFAQRRGLRVLADFDLSKVSQFRSEWKDGPRSSAKKLERLRAFFRFAQKRKWVTENPALDLKAPKITLCPTLPFGREEMVRILAATDQYREEMPSHGIENGRRIRGLVLLLRYSGMRIGDGVNFSTDRLEGNRLFLYTQKTGVPVNTNLPNGHAHRFRDTFAVELLLAGVPIERVSILLGHQSVRITEKHYAPWVRARQEQLEADVRRTWLTHEPERRVHDGHTGTDASIIPFKSRRKNGGGGGSRTPVRKALRHEAYMLSSIPFVSPATLRMSKKRSRLVRC